MGWEASAGDGHLRRLAAATLLASFDGPTVPSWVRRAIDDGLGGVCLFGTNLGDGAEPVTRALHDACPDLMVALDEEGGDVTRVEAATGSSVPGNAALGAVDDPDLTRRLATALGRALRADGIDLDLAPVADVNSEAANPVIGVRSFGDDAELVGRHVAAFVDGLQSAGVAACTKHFPGHGSTRLDSHLDLPVVDADLDLLRRRELVPFAAAVRAGTATVMTAHLVVPALDDRPATVSPVVLGLLRDELGFDGAIVTDALDMEGIGGPGRIPATAVAALAAGADLLCLGPQATPELVDACIEAIAVAVRRGDVGEERLAEAAHRVGRIPREPVADGASDESGLVEVGADAARRALRIEGKPVLPLHGAHVVELDRPPMVAAGEVPWGVADALTALDPSSTGERLAGESEVPAALRRAAGRPLVLAVRDPHRNAAQARAVAAVTAARPDALVIDLGWPAPGPGPGAARITTFGSSRASGRAVARLLAGVDEVPGRTSG